MNSKEMKKAYKSLRKHERKEILEKEWELFKEELDKAYPVALYKSFIIGATMGTVVRVTCNVVKVINKAVH